MEAYGLTDIGRMRQQNQDSIWYSSEPVGELPNLFLVADGMGGHVAGDFASRKTVECMVSYLEKAQGGTAENKLYSAVGETNGDIYALSKASPAYSGMGSTLVAAVVWERELVVAHVGDSRLYLLRGGGLRQLTRDHSLVEEMLQRGALDAAGAKVHPRKNVITRAMGVEPYILPDVARHPLEPGDGILLCTDGLSNMLSLEEMESICRAPWSVADRASALVDAANGKGGADNIGVILALGLADGVHTW